MKIGLDEFFDRMFNAGVGLCVIAFLGWLTVAFIFPDNSELKYAFLYRTSLANVALLDRPTDCDWDRAPLGNKACHYKKSVSTRQWAKSTEGKPIVSDDNGKTWTQSTPDSWVNVPSKYVFVSWDKIEDP